MDDGWTGTDSANEVGRVPPTAGGQCWPTNAEAAALAPDVDGADGDRQALVGARAQADRAGQRALTASDETTFAHSRILNAAGTSPPSSANGTVPVGVVSPQLERDTRSSSLVVALQT